MRQDRCIKLIGDAASDLIGHDESEVDTAIRLQGHETCDAVVLFGDVNHLG